MGKQWKQWLIIFLGSKITADHDCNHEIKRHLLLGRKVMTNLDSILKSRDITLPTNTNIPYFSKTLLLLSFNNFSFPVLSAYYGSSSVITSSCTLSHLTLRKILKGCYFSWQMRYMSQERLGYAEVINILQTSVAYPSLPGTCPWLMHGHHRMVDQRSDVLSVEWLGDWNRQSCHHLESCQITVPEGKRALGLWGRSQANSHMMLPRSNTYHSNQEGKLVTFMAPPRQRG